MTNYKLAEQIRSRIIEIQELNYLKTIKMGIEMVMEDPSLGDEIKLKNIQSEIDSIYSSLARLHAVADNIIKK